MIGKIKCTLSNAYSRPLLFALLLGLSLVSSLLTPVLTANAATDYDNWYQTTDTPTITTTYGGQTCNPVDVTTSLFSIYDAAIARGSMSQETKLQIQDIIGGGGQWYMSQIRQSTGKYSITVGYYEQTTANPNQIYFSEDNHSPNDFKNIFVQRNGNAGTSINLDLMLDEDCTTVLVNPSVYSGIISGYGDSIKNVYAANFQVLYPDGYAGPPVNESISPPDPDVFPKIVYSVDDKNFVGIYMRNLAGDGQTINNPDDGLNYDIHWRIYDRDNSPNILIDKRDYPAAPFNYTFKEFGEYKLSVWYEPPNLPPPALPGELPTGYTYHTLNILIKIDGNTYTSSDLKQNCDTTGQNCESVTEYEDCSTYGNDFGGYVWCIVRNSAKKLQSWINLNLVPRPSTVSKSFLQAGDKITNSGGLASVIIAPLSSISSLTLNGCQAITPQLPYVNANLVLPCMRPIYEQRFGTLFVLYQTITTGIISYYVLLGMFATVKGLKDPQNDKIEATQL